MFRYLDQQLFHRLSLCLAIAGAVMMLVNACLAMLEKMEFEIANK